MADGKGKDIAVPEVIAFTSPAANLRNLCVVTADRATSILTQLIEKGSSDASAMEIAVLSSDPQFADSIRSATLGAAAVTWHVQGLTRLKELVEHEDPEVAMKAFDRLKKVVAPEVQRPSTVVQVQQVNNPPEEMAAFDERIRKMSGK